jgi:hypothetical protein
VCIISGREATDRRTAQKFGSGNPEIGGKTQGEKEWLG